jgi:hypothetical protein
VSPPRPTAHDVREYEARRNPCARLVRPEWITACVLGGELLNPETYEMGLAERRSLLGRE